MSVRPAESVELGQVVGTKPSERLPWEPEGPHLLICFKRHQKSTKEPEFLNFGMLVRYCVKYKDQKDLWAEFGPFYTHLLLVHPLLSCKICILVILTLES